jgi:hypothetical protein
MFTLLEMPQKMRSQASRRGIRVQVCAMIDEPRRLERTVSADVDAREGLEVQGHVERGAVIA